jgi:YbbR domain-containing protein
MDKWLRNPNVVKGIALLLGILLWAVVHLDQKSPTEGRFTTVKDRMIYDVQVRPIYDESKFEIVSIDPPSVLIRAEGRESALNKISTSNYEIVLDLTNARKGENRLPLIARNFPPGLDVTVIPSYATVVLDEKQEKEVPVQVNVIGTPAPGLVAGQPVVKPARVLVRLPSSYMGESLVVKADVNIDGAQAAVTKQVKLAVLDAEGKELDFAINPAVVDVEVPVTQPFKRMPLQLKIVGEPPSGFSVSSFQPSIDNVTVYGPQDLLNTLDFYEGPQVNLNGLTGDQNLTLDIPLRARVAQLDPSRLEIAVKIVRSGQKMLEDVPIMIIGQNNVYDTRIANPESGKIDIEVEAAPSILEKLKPQDVLAIVDVSNLPPGSHTIPVTINLPQFVKKLSPDITAEVVISPKTEQR